MELQIGIPPRPPRRISAYALKSQEEFYEKYSAPKSMPPLERSPNYFPWPKTDTHTGDKCPAPPDWQETGLLHHVGYVIEENELRRRATLLTMFEQEKIPDSMFIISGEKGSVSQWGNARSKKRLQKMAVAIASFCFWESQRTPVVANRKIAAFCRSVKQKAQSKSQDAIEYYGAYYSYMADLAWLKKEFYDGKFDK